jgi:hypothetical protein
VIEERFENVRRYRQHPWLASTIEPAPNGADPAAPRRRETRVTADLQAGAETYSLLAASDAELPELEEVVVLGRDFEVKWWAEQVATARRDTAKAVEAATAEAREHVASAESQARAHIEASEREAARRLAQAEQREADARAHLQETATALLEANQSLAELPLLRHNHEELEHLRELVGIIKGSKSWRYLEPLRKLGRAFRRRGG